MIATNRKQKDSHGFPRLGRAPATVRASTSEVLRRSSHAHELLDILGTSWLAMRRGVLGKTLTRA